MRFAIIWRRKVGDRQVVDVIWHVTARTEKAALVVAERFIPKRARPLETEEETMPKESQKTTGAP